MLRKLAAVKIKEKDRAVFHTQYGSFSEEGIMIFLGNIPNMKGHGVFLYNGPKKVSLMVFHTEHFEEV